MEVSPAMLVVTYIQDYILGGITTHFTILRSDVFELLSCP